jgi:hypothetical protein
MRFCISRAERNYVFRLFFAMAAYVAVLVVVSAWLRGTTPPTGALLYAAALAPAVPILVAIWAVGRYVMEETDEYQRLILVRAMLWATGATLAVTTVWGFLETYARAVHAPASGIFMLFCICLGVAQVGLRLLEPR